MGQLLGKIADLEGRIERRMASDRVTEANELMHEKNKLTAQVRKLRLSSGGGGIGGGGGGGEGAEKSDAKKKKLKRCGRSAELLLCCRCCPMFSITAAQYCLTLDPRVGFLLLPVALSALYDALRGANRWLAGN
jgi:hypothetical protein